MWTLPLLAVLLAADPVPVAGRPKDFSGAIGGPFVVTAWAPQNIIPVEVGDPFPFTIQITGPGDLTKLQRPDIEHNPDFAAFTVENGPERDLSPGREYQYILRARSNYGSRIPRVKFVYFNPAIQPAERGFQTTYSEALWSPLLARIPSPKGAHAEWFHRYYLQDKLFGWYSEIDDAYPFLQSVLWLLPVLACAVWYRIARLATSTDLARRQAITRLKGTLADPSRDVATILREFIGSRLGKPLANLTAYEVQVAISSAAIPLDINARTNQLLRDCEQGQFGRGDSDGLVERARELVNSWRKS